MEVIKITKNTLKIRWADNADYQLYLCNRNQVYQ